MYKSSAIFMLNVQNVNVDIVIYAHIEKSG